MPELPEVETVVRELSPFLTGATLHDIVAHSPKLRYPIPDLKFLIGLTVQTITRRGKYILIEFNEGTLLSHLGMSGKWLRRDSLLKKEKHDHVSFSAQKNKQTIVYFSYNDTRRFGFFQWIPKNEKSLFLERLGPEPLDNWLLNDFKIALKKRKTAIKKTIMDNAVVVGVGNIYASEALFQAKIHPETESNLLNAQDVSRLHKSIQAVLMEGIKAKGASVKTYRRTMNNEGHMSLRLHVYGKAGDPCAVCQTPISSKTIGGRNTFWCPTCQIKKNNATPNKEMIATKRRKRDNTNP